MVIRKNWDILTCFESLQNISRISILKFKGNHSSGDSIVGAAGREEKYRNKTFHCLKSMEKHRDFISDTPESSGATNGKSQFFTNKHQLDILEACFF